jgi:branched-chain amino acid transport system permease protein
MKNRFTRIKWTILAALTVGLGTMPVWGSQYAMLFFMLFCIYLALAQMWNLLAGYSGLISLGQQSFIGLGGYTVAVLSSYYGMNIWIGVGLGGVASVLLALFMSLFIFRMKGVYFAIGTWIFAEALLVWFSNWAYVKYGSGLFIKPANGLSMAAIYYAAFVVGAGSVALVYILLRSGLGLGLMAIREDDQVSETLGVEVFRLKLYCFLISALVTGIIAGIFYVFQIFIQPYKAFAIDWTVKLVFMVIIGGIGTIEGPILGALIYVVLSQFLAEYFSVSMLILGGIAIGVILIAPKGIMGTLQEKLGFELLSPRRN